jgi:hypothetical protein
MDTLSAEKGKISTTTLVQKRGNDLVLVHFAWSGSPLCYAHGNTAYVASAVHPGKVEFFDNVQPDFYLRMRDSVQFMFGFSDANGRDHVGLDLDFAQVLRAAMSRQISSAHDDSSGIWTIRTAHAIVVSQLISPPANGDAEMRYLEMSFADARGSVVVLFDKSNEFSVPPFTLRENIPELIPGDADSAKAIFQQSDSIELWKNPDFLKGVHGFGALLSSGAFLLEACGLNETESLLTARMIAEDVCKDQSLKLKIHQKFDDRLKELNRQMTATDIPGKGVLDRYHRILELGDFAEDLHVILPDAGYFEFAKRYLDHPTATAERLGQMEELRLLLDDVQSLQCTDLQRGAAALATMKIWLGCNRLDDEYRRSRLSLEEFRAQESALGDSTQKVLRTTVLPQSELENAAIGGK